MYKCGGTVVVKFSALSSIKSNQNWNTFIKWLVDHEKIKVLFEIMDSSFEDLFPERNGKVLIISNEFFGV